MTMLYMELKLLYDTRYSILCGQWVNGCADLAMALASLLCLSCAAHQLRYWNVSTLTWAIGTWRNNYWQSHLLCDIGQQSGVWIWEWCRSVCFRKARAKQPKESLGRKLNLVLVHFVCFALDFLKL